MRDLKTLAEGLSGKAMWSEPLSRHTTLQVGGPADLFYVPSDLEDLIRLVRRAHEAKIPLFVLGGSNLVVCDGGIRGVVVNLSQFVKVRAVGDGRIEADAGIPLARLSRFAADRGLTGLEFALGIPGTLGGGVVMNAGTGKQEMGNLVESVRVVTWKGELVEAKSPEIAFGYRWSRLPGGIVASAVLALRPDTAESIRHRMQEQIRYRKETQPLTQPNAGSIFKNPESGFSAQMIEAAGLKGERIGDAQISERHANFIVNRGHATAKDVVKLIRKVGRVIERKSGVRLELEVRIVGTDR